jgi:DNA-binding NarL/FixJ family response regulator
VDQLGSLDPEDLVLLYSRASLQVTLADLRQLRHRAPWAQVVMIGDAELFEEHDRLRAVGVSAVISDDSSFSALIGAVWVVQAGLSVVADHPPLVWSQKPADGWVTAAPSPPPSIGRHVPGLPLSGQEVRILGKLVQGGSNKDIANELGIAEATVKVHLRACYDKIGVKNRTQAALWASVNLRETP